MASVGNGTVKHAADYQTIFCCFIFLGGWSQQLVVELIDHLCEVENLSSAQGGMVVSSINSVYGKAAQEAVT